MPTRFWSLRQKRWCVVVLIGPIGIHGPRSIVDARNKFRREVTLQRDSSVIDLVRLNIGRLNRLIGKLGVPEVRSNEQTQTDQYHGKTEQGADQLARYSRRPGNGTCFQSFSQNLLTSPSIPSGGKINGNRANWSSSVTVSPEIFAYDYIPEDS